MGIFPKYGEHKKYLKPPRNEYTKKGVWGISTFQVQTWNLLINDFECWWLISWDMQRKNKKHEKMRETKPYSPIVKQCKTHDM